MTKFQAHQGDVFVEEINDLPVHGSPMPADNGRHILAHGEATGHHHSIRAGSAVMFRDDGLAYSAILEVTDEVPLVHQEHAPVTLPQKKLGVILQSVYEPNEIRTVQD